MPVILVSGNLKSDEGLDYRTRLRVERLSFDRRCKNQLRYPNQRVLGKVRFPKDTLDNWDRSHDTECQQRPSSTSSLILIEPAGDQETNASAKGNTSASDQHDLRNCKTFSSHRDTSDVPSNSCAKQSPLPGQILVCWLQITLQEGWSSSKCSFDGTLTNEEASCIDPTPLSFCPGERQIRPLWNHRHQRE